MTEHKHVNPWIVAVAVMFATFMEVLDTTVVNVSLPHIAGNLSATIDESTWVLTSYLVANAIILPMTGWLARNFGRKRLLMASITGFTVSSLLCGLAPTLSMLVLFRIIQGATVEGVSQEQASARMQTADKARAAYVRRLYRVDPADASLYHMVIDSTAIPLDTVIELILTAARSHRGESIPKPSAQT